MNNRQQSTLITRLAPSPTGNLHLGNAWAFLLAWLLARQAGGKVLLRMDDIDPARSRQSFAGTIINDLDWLGLTWDGPIIWQSQRFSLYEQALRCLQAKKLVYPCFCTRKELRSLASAPHIGDAGVAYPGTCASLSDREQQKLLASGKSHALRLRTPQAPVIFHDLFQGCQSFTRAEYGGDFPLMRSDGVWSYQLASIVDDLDLDVNLVLRGRDLLPSTPRQILLANALDRSVPQFAHIPLLLDEDGNRLAKRHQSLSLASLREHGVTAARVLAWLGRLAIPHLDTAEISAPQLVAVFDPCILPQSDLVLSAPMIELLIKAME